MALVSVITPNFNGAQFLEAAIDSVQQQNYSLIEHIIVDDGSTDGSPQLIHQLAKKYPNVKVVCLATNSGVSTARNVGIEHASGKYVAFLDADDQWHPEKIRKQIDCFEKHPNAGVVVTSTQLMDASGQAISDPKESRRKVPVKSGKVSIYDYIYGKLPVSINAMTQKKCIDQVGGFNPNYVIGEDYELWMRILEHFDYYYIDEPLHFYRVHTTNATSNKLKNRESKLKILEELMAKKPDLKKELGQQFSIIMQRKYNSLGKAYVKHRKLDKAKATFTKVHQFNGSFLQRVKSYLWMFYLKFAKS